MKDENQDYEGFFYYLSSGRSANIIYCLDASPFSQNLFFRSSFGSLTYPDMLLLPWESPMQEAVSIAGEALLGNCLSLWDEGHVSAISYLCLDIFPLIPKLLIWMILLSRL